MPVAPVTTVTLVTGDRVTLGGDVAVRAGQGREGISFRGYRDERGEVHVVPADAARLVATGRLDPRLFNVTGLVRDGYDDATRADLPLIVDYAGATTRSAGAGTALWPHDDDQPIGKTLSYTNSGTEPVTIDLTAGMTGPAGAAPAGMITVRPSQVTVPAGGRADATLTIDTTVTAPDGQYTGAVTATSGNTAIRTPVAINREVESYNVKLTVLDHDGNPTPDYEVQFVDLDRHIRYGESARLPKGRYYFDAWAGNTAYAEPAYLVDGNAEIVLDARNGRPITVHVDEPNARSGTAHITFSMKTALGDVGLRLDAPSLDDLFVIPSTTSSENFTVEVETKLAEPAASRHLYNLRWSETGRVPDSLDRTFRDRDLAKVRAHYAVATPGRYGLRDNFLARRLPFTLTEYCTPDVPWYPLLYVVADPNDPFALLETSADTVIGRVYRKGKVVHERWNVGVFGPAFPTPDYYPSTYARRYGNDVIFDLPLHADQPRSHEGFGSTMTGTTELLRDGELIGKSEVPGYGEFVMPAESATYTLRTTATRDTRLSTVVSAEWTFRSATAPGDRPAMLPLLAIRFAPNLNDHNDAPAGNRFHIPVYVQRNASPAATDIRKPSVEVSFDEGATWKPAPVSRHGKEWLVKVNHPTHAEFVSLRASTTDAGGNAVTQTILRAYALATGG